MKIEHATSAVLAELWGQVEAKARQEASLEEAAQELAYGLHAKFSESAVLVRAFLTVPFDSLPKTNQEFVRKLAESAGAGGQLKGNTLVLSLLGTHGQEANWNDRRNSKGHMGIPLISSAFVDAIPMISRLLRELGVPLEWVDTRDSEILQETVGRSAGLFFVDNAAQAKDHQGRNIIASQDFVSAYQVKSVFGTGGVYSGNQVLVIVLFCRDQFARAVGELFLPLIDSFKGRTASLAGAGKIFSDGN